MSDKAASMQRAKWQKLLLQKLFWQKGCKTNRPIMVAALVFRSDHCLLAESSLF
jgi:hypothetical protein